MRVTLCGMAPLSLEALGWLLVGPAAVKGDGSAAALTAALRLDKTASGNYSTVRTMLRRFGYSDVLDLYRSHEATARWIETGVLPNGEADAEYGLRAASSRLQQYVTLCALCNPERRCGTSVSSGAPEAAVSLFRARMTEQSEAEEKRRMKNELTPRERASILPWDTIREMYAVRRGTLESRERLLADLYLMCPLDNPPKRLDYGAVRLVSVQTTERGGVGLDATLATPGVLEGGDVLVLCPETHRGVLRLHAYKTHSTYGDFQQELPRRLVDAVLEGLPSETSRWRAYLLQASADGGRPLSESSLQKLFTSTMVSITRYAIGVSNLRKSFLSHLLNVPDLSEERRAAIARLMMHSLEMQMKYRRVDLSSVV